MSFYKKSFDFFGKMNNNKNFYIFNTTSPTDSSEIISKFEKYETAPEIFRHYSNNDIKRTFKSIENLENLYSSLYNEKKTNILKSKIDIYISTLSNIFLLSNLITKNKLILNKAIDKTKINLDLFFTNNKVDNNIQKELNNYIFHLIDDEEEKSKRKTPSYILNDNLKKYKTFTIDNFNIYIPNGKTNNFSAEINIIDHSMNTSYLNQEKTRDITKDTFINNLNNNSKIIEENLLMDKGTPAFPNKVNESSSNNQQLINDDNNKLYELSSKNNDKLYDNGSKNNDKNTSKHDSIKSICNNNDLNKKLLKKESICSLYTLASKSKFQEERRSGTCSKFKGVFKDDNYMKNNINHNLYNTNNIKRNSNFLRSINKQFIKDNDDLYKDEIKHKLNKEKHSSIDIKINKGKIMYKNLLIFINNLFKLNKIDSEEKLKLKELIIIKSENLDDIYSKYYASNKETLIDELKKLIK